MKISLQERKLITSILAKVEKSKNTPELFSFADLYKILNREEISLCKKILKLKPSTFGFRGKYLGIHKVPKKIRTFKGQVYTIRRKRKRILPQYAPLPVFNAFNALQKALKKETGKTLFVESGYRSPAYQLCTFLHILRIYKWNIEKTFKRVALPGYSEHGDKNTALDFITSEGIPQEGNLYRFARTPEYAWLLKNAGRFGFRLSYPKDNKLGVMFEPWHWRFIGVR